MLWKMSSSIIIINKPERQESTNVLVTTDFVIIILKLYYSKLCILDNFGVYSNLVIIAQAVMGSIMKMQ